MVKAINIKKSFYRYIASVFFIISIIYSFLQSSFINNSINPYIEHIILFFACVLSYLVVDRKKTIDIRLLILYIIFSITISLSFFLNSLYNDNALFGIGSFIGTLIVLLILLVDNKELKESFLYLINFLSLFVIISSFADNLSLIDLSNYKEYDYTSITTTRGYSWIFINPNTYGMFLFFLFSYITIFFRENMIKYIYMISIYFLMILSVSRGALLSSLVIFIGFLFETKKKYTIILCSFVAVVSVLYYVFFAYFNIDIQNYINIINIKNDYGSTHRTEIWDYVIHEYIIKNSHEFLLGNGADFGSITEFGGLSSHNSFLNFIGKFGFISAFFLFLFLFYYIKRLVLRPKLLFFVISILVYAFVESAFFSGENGVWIGTVILLTFFEKNTPRKSLYSISSYSKHY